MQRGKKAKARTENQLELTDELVKKIEHINGVVKGIGQENSIGKKGRRRKSKNEARNEVEKAVLNGIEDCLAKEVVREDSLELDIENRILTDKPKHSRKKKSKLKQLDTNENISKDNEIQLESREENSETIEEKPSGSQEKEAKVEEEIADRLSNIELSPKPLAPSPLVEFIQYESELQMPMIMRIIQKDLSEPYSIYTYRYFIHNWPKLCFLAMCENECVGAIVCKLDIHRKVIKRGYIAMLAVDQNFRKLRIGSNLVQMAIQEMINGEADEVVLETEVTNKPALQLYEKLGFVRDKRLFRYYLNGVDALRLKLWLR